MVGGSISVKGGFGSRSLLTRILARALSFGFQIVEARIDAKEIGGIRAAESYVQTFVCLLAEFLHDVPPREGPVGGK